MMFVVLTVGICVLQVGYSQEFAKMSEDVDVYYPNLKWSDSFDWKLFKEYSSQYRNLLLSPVSLKTMLSLLYQGSAGVTKREFEGVLQYRDQEAARENSKKITDSLKISESTESHLDMGLNVFLDSSMTPQQKFASVAKTHYNADIIPTNFNNKTEAGNTINSWSKTLTEGKISHLVDPAELEDAVMVIANVLYFKGLWKYPFSNKTVEKFHVLDGTTFFSLQTRFITVENKFYYHESSTLDAKILRLPYKGGRYSMFILLPNSKGGLRSLIRQINLSNIKQMLYVMDQRLVNVKIPEFKFEFQARFSQALQDFGLLQMFENTASFPGIVRGNSTILRKLTVSDIIQKSGIEINEFGTVVYAASALTIGNKIGQHALPFHATHPFLFYIEEEPSGTVLFVGKVENPLEVAAPSMAAKPE